MIKTALALVGLAVASQGATITRESSYAADLTPLPWWVCVIAR
jgi:hypothetical protein